MNGPLSKLTPEFRSYLYSVGFALMPILVLLKVVTASDVPLYLAMLYALLGLGVATAYRPTGPAGPTEMDIKEDLRLK